MPKNFTSLFRKQGWLHGYPSRVLVGGGSGESHSSIWAGAVSLGKLINAETEKRGPTNQRRDKAACAKKWKDLRPSSACKVKIISIVFYRSHFLFFVAFFFTFPCSLKYLRIQRRSVCGDWVGKCENAHFQPCPPVRDWYWPCIRPCFRSYPKW